MHTDLSEWFAEKKGWLKYMDEDVGDFPELLE